MTENKQITIEQLLPLMSRGFVACQQWGEWYWFPIKPEKNSYSWIENGLPLSIYFNIRKFDGDWKDSLMEVK